MLLLIIMCKEYLLDRSFQKIQEVIANHYRTYKSPPTYATLSQTFQGDYDAIELLETFREYEEENTNTESLTNLLEGYIKGVRLQKVYTQVGKLYNQNRQDKAEALHYQLEGSEQEALDAYSGGIISRNAYYFKQGKISDREFKHFEELVMSYAGSITVRSFPRFAARISTMDIKNGIAEYRKNQTDTRLV